MGQKKVLNGFDYRIQKQIGRTRAEWRDELKAVRRLEGFQSSVGGLMDAKYKVVHRWQRVPNGGWWVEVLMRRLTLEEATAEVQALCRYQTQPGVYAVEPEASL